MTTSPDHPSPDAHSPDSDPPDAPAPSRGVGAALAVVTIVAAVAYGWGAWRVAVEPYYAAAARSMAGSWHAFAFGAVDPDATVTLDKLPGAFWVQALSVRLFGVHTWALVLPQVIEGVAAILVLFVAVRRLAGPGAGLLAAAVLALSPAVVALDRGNISDSLMILLLVAAAAAVSGAVVRGGTWRLALAGLWVGLAFQAKMIEAWLVLPALAIAFLVAGPGSWWRRLGGLGIGGGVAAVVSMAWVLVVTALPVGSRPWVDGSTHDSLLEQVFTYNGIGRLGGASNPLQVLAGQGIGLVTPAGPAGWDRLLTGDLARGAGWLLPLALVVAVVGVVARGRRPRTDPLRACYVLWGMWLLLYAVAFSAASMINAYYTAALGPAVAALLGLAVVDLWRQRESVTVRLLAAVAVAGTVAYAAALVVASGPAAPSWLAPGAIVVGVLASGLLVASAARHRGGGLWRAAVGAGLIAVLLVPAVASAGLVVRGRSALDTPFEPRRTEASIDRLFVATPRLAARALPALERVRGGAPALLAIQSSAAASVFSYPAGEEALPIGGFTGTGPHPTVDELRADVAAGRFHLALLLPSPDPRSAYLTAHCRPLPPATPPFRAVFCNPADAR